MSTGLFRQNVFVRFVDTGQCMSLSFASLAPLDRREIADFMARELRGVTVAIDELCEQPHDAIIRELRDLVAELRPELLVAPSTCTRAPDGYTSSKCDHITKGQ